MLKVGISASFLHGDQTRAIFQGMTLQFIEQNVAHWLMQRDVLAFMVPSPDGATRRPGSGVTVDDYARELDALGHPASQKLATVQVDNSGRLNDDLIAVRFVDLPEMMPCDNSLKVVVQVTDRDGKPLAGSAQGC